jgi:transcriptional regulator with XRE-family HTH domain
MDSMATRIDEILKELKKTRDISPAQIARQIGVDKGAVSKWVSGATKNMKNHHLFLFEDLYGYSARWIATGEGPRMVSAVREQAAEYVIRERVAQGELLDIAELPTKARSVLRAAIHAFEEPNGVDGPDDIVSGGG